MTGEKISNFRKTLGLTQAELARALEVSSVTVNRWEKNDPRYKPSDKQIRLIEALGEILEANPKESGQRVQEMRDALRVLTADGIVGKAAICGAIAPSTVGILAATAGLGWIGLIAGASILGASLPFFTNLKPNETKGQKHEN